MAEEHLQAEITVNLGGQHQNERFRSLRDLRAWRESDGKDLVVRMVTFTGVGGGTTVRRDFEDGETVGMLYDHGGVLGFSASGDQSIELLAAALDWYDAIRCGAQ